MLMLDELLGTWLDKRKVKRELLKAFKFYQKKKKPYLHVNTIEIYEELQNIEFAIAYILCEHFNVKCDNPFFSNKWNVYYDYTHRYDECKEAYEKFAKENNTTEHNYSGDAWSIDNLKTIIIQEEI